MASYQTEVDRLIALANGCVGPGGSVDKAKQAEIPAAVLQLCKCGVPGRLAAVEQSYRITDALSQHNVVAQVIRGDPARRPEDAIHSEALWLLANSSRQEHWDLLAEIAIVFDKGVFYEGVPRRELKRALAAAWRKASGATRLNLEESLTRRDFRRMFGVWI